MYILGTLPCTPAELDRLLHWFSDMFHRLCICLTAFLASAGIFTQQSVLASTGVQAQYLLGLGETSCVVVCRA